MDASAYPYGDGGASFDTAVPMRNYTGRQVAPESGGAVAMRGPCGACKVLRRKCVPGCIFAPYFDPDQGATRFAAVHKVFGASNASKLLMHIPDNLRHEAAITISYEAEARLSNPVYGCVSTLLSLKQQVASLQQEVAMVKTQIMNRRFEVENAIRTSQLQLQQQQQQYAGMLQPAFFNTPSSSNNLLMNDTSSFSSFNNNFSLIGEASAPISQSFGPIISQPSHPSL